MINESTIRSRARRAGLSLQKARTRNPASPNYGCFRITDPFWNVVVAGGHPFDFSLTLDEADGWLCDRAALRSDPIEG